MTRCRPAVPAARGSSEPSQVAAHPGGKLPGRSRHESATIRRYGAGLLHGISAMTAAELQILEAPPGGDSVPPPGRVVHVIGAFIAGGAERFVAELSGQLQVRGFEVAVWALSPRTDEV